MNLPNRRPAARVNLQSENRLNSLSASYIHIFLIFLFALPPVFRFSVHSLIRNQIKVA